MIATLARRLYAIFLFALLVLTACSAKLASPLTREGDANSRSSVTPNYSQTLAAIHVKSTKEYLSEDPEVLGYHAVLMVERAADLIVTYSAELQTDQIQLSDASARRLYTEAFSVAVDTFNKTTPPKSMSEPWQNVYRVIQQYNQAYEALRNGKSLASTDLSRLRTSRQLLSNYVKKAEANLAQRGLGPEFLTAKQEEVEQHFQEAYGNEPLPTAQP